MPGSPNDILPEPMSQRSEEIVLDLVKRKMKSASAIAVELLHAMEERFGPEEREVVHEMARGRKPTPRPNAGQPQEDLKQFCALLDERCVGSHIWERVIDEPGRIGYEYTRCMWAEIFRELGEPELGLFLCAGDDPAVRSYNPSLGFKRTKVMMSGDRLCDHVFYVEK